MTDLDLLMFGCGIMFTVFAGAYVVLRERFIYSDEADARRNPRLQPARARSQERRPNRRHIRAA